MLKLAGRGRGGASREQPPSTVGDPLELARTGRGSGPRACLTSEARSSRGPPVRPQRARKRVGGAQQLDSFFSFFDKPFLVFLDSVLVAAVLYHALNGVRILLMDFGIGIKRHKAVFWICMLIAAAAVWGFAYKAIPFIF